jgi:GNAT superfamily N-acetyltransferase
MSSIIERAGDADAEEIAALVNRAYRPGEDGRGWTSERGLVGGMRTSPEQVRALAGARSAILVMRCAAAICACVHVEAHGELAHIGMLATEPGAQAQGIGKLMLAAAEAFAASEFDAAAFRMSVLSGRDALLAFYLRRGYRASGTTTEFPLDAGVGRPVADGLTLIELLKDRPR